MNEPMTLEYKYTIQHGGPEGIYTLFQQLRSLVVRRDNTTVTVFHCFVFISNVPSGLFVDAGYIATGLTQFLLDGVLKSFDSLLYGFVASGSHLDGSNDRLKVPCFQSWNMGNGTIGK